MKKRFTEAQIAFALRQEASGTPVAEITRKMGITDVMPYRWSKVYANLDIAESVNSSGWRKRLIA